MPSLGLGTSQSSPSLVSDAAAAAAMKDMGILIGLHSMAMRRRYQLELCKKALEENIIVYLETGCGKTHIAVLPMYEPVDTQTSEEHVCSVEIVVVCMDQIAPNGLLQWSTRKNVAIKLNN
ncbi:hypothetical protein ABKV19_000475 [Rosa sericea]